MIQDSSKGLYKDGNSELKTYTFTIVEWNEKTNDYKEIDGIFSFCGDDEGNVLTSKQIEEFVWEEEFVDDNTYELEESFLEKRLTWYDVDIKNIRSIQNNILKDYGIQISEREIIETDNGFNQTYKTHVMGYQLKVIGNKVNGVYQGIYTEYYLNGKKHSEGKMKDGELDGLLKGYDEKGWLKSKQNFKNGETSGIQKGFYREGQLEYEVYYEEGDEVWNKWYYPNGQLKYTENYKDEERISYTCWYENGDEVESDEKCDDIICGIE